MRVAPAPAPPRLPPGPVLKAGAEKFRIVRGADDTGATSNCMPLVPPQSWGVPYQFQILQGASYVAIFHEYPGTFRIIPTDGSPHPVDPDPSWLGDSVGHWEGDTLVVDTIGFNDKTELQGFRHTEGLHMIEKFRRTEFDVVQYEVTIEDPNVFEKPYTLTRSFALRPRLEADRRVHLREQSRLPAALRKIGAPTPIGELNPRQPRPGCPRIDVPLSNSWIFPVVQSIHLVGIALLVGTIVLVDLRILGFGARGHTVSQTRGPSGACPRGLALQSCSSPGRCCLLRPGAVLEQSGVSRQDGVPAARPRIPFHDPSEAHRLGSRPVDLLWSSVVIGGRAIADFDV